ncbi:MAG: pyridoxal 5'-phosphate synthase glutaminase subunit PdxT [Solirubrobacteraceae bacterium]
MARTVGVLSLQGGFEAHARILVSLGAQVREVRVPAQLAGLDALVLPGGESTTMMLGLAREGLEDPLREFAATGAPILATCAGMIILDRAHLGILDLLAERNAFGRQPRSFEADLDIRGLSGGSLRGVFIRAPWIVEPGPRVELLAEYEMRAVAARQQAIVAVAFHPELAGETRLHAQLLG